MPYLNDPVAEIMDIYAYEQRRARLRARAASFTPDSARLVSAYARHSPWIKPGVNLGLSAAGIPPSDPRVNQISAQSLASDPRFQHAGAQYGAEVKASQLNPGLFGSIGNFVGEQVSTVRRKSAEELHDIGWRGLDEILNEHPELRGIVRSASAVIKDGIPRRPRNTLTEKGIKFDALQKAFLKAGVDLPFVNDDERWEEKNERYGIIRGSDSSATSQTAGRIEWLDEELAPAGTTEGSSGGGVFSQGQLSVPVPGAGRLAPRRQRPDSAMQEKLRSAGIAMDPANPLAPASFLVRPGLMALDAPIQEAQGQFRNVIAAAEGKPVNWTESQSDLGVMLGSAQRGQSLDPGSGFFIDPESEVARERRIREAKRGQIGGHSITIGRWLADTVTEPDTTPFNILSGTVDAGVQIADPSSYALGKIGKVRQARSLFEASDVAHDAAGLVPALRRSIHGPTAAQWLNSDDGVRSIEALAGETSPARIWVAMGRRTDPQVAARFADAQTTDEVRNILEEFIGPHIRTPAELEAAASRLTSGVSPLDSPLSKLNPRHSQSRLFNWMPGPHLDTTDPRQFATHIERHMINAKVPSNLIEEVLNDVARSDSPSGLFNAATKAMSHEEGTLVAAGISKEHARSLTTLFREDYNTQIAGLTDEIGDDAPTWTKMYVGGKAVDVPGPHLPLEHVGRYIPLPEPRRIRRLTSNPALRFLTTSKGPEAFGQNRLPIALMDFLTQEIWKTTTLLGRFPAWISRVVGESQIRMATAGHDSLFRHPIDALGWVTGRVGKVSPTGISLDEVDEFRNSLTTTHGGWLSRPGAVRSARPIIIPKREEYASQFRDAWADELSLLSNDPVSKFILNNGIDETERWLMVGTEGKKVLRTLRESRPGSLMDHKSIQDYLHSVARRITHHTGGNTDLIEALKAGKLGDISIMSQVSRTNPKFSRKLEEYLDAAPDKVKGLDVDMRRAGMSFPERWNRGIDWAFSHTMGLADNLWDRAPTFKQYLWQHTRELMPFATADAQQKILTNAREANLPSRLFKGLEKAARRSTDDGLSLDELDMLAKGYAADSAKKLLYDLSERGQLADAVRIIAPFGNAYQEIFGAWGKLLTDMGGGGPVGFLIGAAKTLRRSQQLIEGARGEDFGSVVGAPAGEGFFFTDQYGEEVFVIPGSQWLTTAITGAGGGAPIPTPMTGSVQGLNMVGNIVPGLGPVAAVPTAWIIQDKPALNGIHDLILPYGAPGERAPSDIAQLLNYAPPWTRRAFDALTNGGYDQRLWANSQKDAMAYLYSTGEYDLTTREGLNQLTSDAKDSARDLYTVRAMSQFFSPTTPSFRFLIEDKTGSLLATSVLVEDYYTLQKADYENASQNFMELYGENAILAVIPKSGASVYGIPRNQEQLNFVLNNPQVKKNFPSTYGFFLPQSEEFDYEVYLRGFTGGERDELSADQWLNLSNSMRGDMLYRRYVEQVGGRTDKAARDYLGEVRRQILETFPSGPTGLAEKPDTEEMVAELYRAVEDETVLDTDAGQGLALYLQYRDEAQAYAEALDRSSFNQSKDTEPVRVWLNEAAQKVIERHPGFQFVWDIVLSREARLED
jgi:hypothetical protein